ncbi:hypothetical protein [Stutzerimonas kirkiae]|uniref:Glycine zipper family protein n=1 Tax=Stutzerimonas kirkiae TaxID=2211392 RepID=A0A4Q9R6P6_9GAMM|nr:hypothetical protein [Stutzerimonas kirkiae]TBU96075.1 hypothetical protein DNJ96_11335 [Stutzerimonas kirkiae]TBV03135.1 hypothetical protein DNJ95_07670 [Stutzerimonas kirkiae]TBV09823.1 hypothetical protein DNK08_08000 [Stutzerimonas kirkiae]
MRSSSFRSIVAGVLVILCGLPVQAEPRGPGGPGGGHSGPGRPDYHAPGPRHGHGLPSAAREIWIGSTLYFLAAGTYYLWNADRKTYVVASPPPAANVEPANYQVIAYPASGQSTEQQAKDRYECHSWAVSQSGFDPLSVAQSPSETAATLYRRAQVACLTGRGYSVN